MNCKRLLCHHKVDILLQDGYETEDIFHCENYGCHNVGTTSSDPNKERCFICDLKVCSICVSLMKKEYLLSTTLTKTYEYWACIHCLYYLSIYTV
jgi:hypothetical protein